MLSLLRAAPSVVRGSRISSIAPFQGIVVRYYHPRGDNKEEDDAVDPTDKPKFEKRDNKQFGNRSFGDREKRRFDRGGQSFGNSESRPGGFQRGGFQREGGFQKREGGGGFQREGRGNRDFQGNRGGDFRGNDKRPWAGRPNNQDGGQASGKFRDDRFAPRERRQFDSAEKPGFKKMENWSGPNRSADGAPQLTPAQKKAMNEQKATEVTVHGFHACMAIFHRRPESIAKVYITEENVVPFGDVLKYLAKSNIGYTISDSAQIEKISSTEHHEGVAFVVKKKELTSVDDAIQKGTVSSIGTKDLTQPCLLFLDNLRNPHNLGSMLRAAAFFGVQTIFSYNTQDQQFAANPLTPAAYRVAQGGAESVDIAVINNEDQALATLKKLKQKGCKIITTSSHFTDSTTSMYSPKAAEMFLPTHPVVLLVGNERDGVSPALAAQADASIRIPSTGWVESLNVVQAASVIFGELWRARGGSLASHSVSSSFQKDLEVAREKWRNKPQIEKTFGSKRETAAESDYNAELDAETQRLAQELLDARDKKREARAQFAQERQQENRMKAAQQEKGKEKHNHQKGQMKGKEQEKANEKEEQKDEAAEEHGEEGEKEEAGVVDRQHAQEHNIEHVTKPQPEVAPKQEKQTVPAKFTDKNKPNDKSAKEEKAKESDQKQEKADKQKVEKAAEQGKLHKDKIEKVKADKVEQGFKEQPQAEKLKEKEKIKIEVKGDKSKEIIKAEKTKEILKVEKPKETPKVEKSKESPKIEKPKESAEKKVTQEKEKQKDQKAEKEKKKK